MNNSTFAILPHWKAISAIKIIKNPTLLSSTKLKLQNGKTK